MLSPAHWRYCHLEATQVLEAQNTPQGRGIDATQGGSGLFASLILGVSSRVIGDRTRGWRGGENLLPNYRPHALRPEDWI